MKKLSNRTWVALFVVLWVGFLAFSPAIQKTVASGVQALATVVAGGTGRSTLTAHATLVGNGTGNVALVSPSATVGWCFESNGAAADPSFQACTSGGGTVTSVATSCGASGGTFTTSGTITGVGVCITIANAGSTGTTANTLTKLTGAPSTAVIVATTDTVGAIGVVDSGAGTAGNAVIYELGSGQHSCVFDNATVAGHYVQISGSTAGNCHDTGSATYPTGGGQVIGVVLSTNGGGGTYTVDFSLGQRSIASSSGGTVTSVATGCGASGGTITGTGTITGVGVCATIANAGSTGTTLNTLTKLTGAPSTAVITATTDTIGAIGIVDSGAGTTSNAVIYEIGSGQHSCVFDGATTAGHYVQISGSTAGNCHDTGSATYPTSGGQVIGVVLSTNGGGGTYTVDFSLGQRTLPSASTAYPLTFVQDGMCTSGNNTSSVTCTFQSTTASSGNTIFMIVATDGSAAVGTPGGWTVDLNQTQASFARFMLLHKATASDTSATFTLSASSMQIGYFEVTGTHALDVSSTGGSANTQFLTLPAITPTAGSAVFAMVAVVNGTTAPGFMQSPVNPNWSVYLNQLPNTNASGRQLMGFRLNIPASNVSTKPPVFSIPNSSTFLFGGGGMAYATFSIL